MYNARQFRSTASFITIAQYYHVFMSAESENASTERRHVVSKHVDFLMGGWGFIDLKKVLLNLCPTIKCLRSPK